MARAQEQLVKLRAQIEFSPMLNEQLLSEIHSDSLNFYLEKTIDCDELIRGQKQKELFQGLQAMLQIFKGEVVQKQNALCREARLKLEKEIIVNCAYLEKIISRQSMKESELQSELDTIKQKLLEQYEERTSVCLEEIKSSGFEDLENFAQIKIQSLFIVNRAKNLEEEKEKAAMLLQTENSEKLKNVEIKYGKELERVRS